MTIQKELVKALTALYFEVLLGKLQCQRHFCPIDTLRNKPSGLSSVLLIVAVISSPSLTSSTRMWLQNNTKTRKEVGKVSPTEWEPPESSQQVAGISVYKASWLPSNE